MSDDETRSYSLNVNVTYKDTGCEFSDSCLDCPLPKCAEDKGAKLEIRRARQAQQVLVLTQAGQSPRRIAHDMGVSTRTVTRALANAQILLGAGAI